MHRLSWDILDLAGNLVARLDGRKPGAQIGFSLNRGRTATVALDANDPALRASASFGDSPVLNRRLRVWDPEVTGSSGLVLFSGRIFAPSVRRRDHTVQLSAFDPWAMLDRDIIADVTGTSAVQQLRYHRFGPAVDQSNIAQQIVGYGGLDHGIYAPSSSLAAASVSRDLKHPVGKTLGQALRDLTDLDNGPDVDLVPIIDATRDAQLFTYYPKRGTDKSSSVVFEYGHGRQSALDVQTEPAGEAACNYLVVIASAQIFGGDWRLAYVAQHAASIATYGKLARFEERETTDWTELGDYAKGQVGQLHDPTAFFSFTQAPQSLAAPPEPTVDPEQGTPPSFGPSADYYLGDTIAVRVQPDGCDDPELQYTLKGRVTDATLTELDSGQLQAACECGPEIDSSGVTGTRFAAYLPDLSTV